MKKNIKFISTIIFLCLILLFSCGSQKPKDKKQIADTAYAKTRILIVFSSNTENIWSKQVNIGISHFLLNKGYNIETQYMNITVASEQEFKQQAGKMVMDKFNTFKPGIVLAIDDDAQQYFARELSGNEKVDVVFCGVEKDPAQYNYPRENVTGILKRPQLKQTILLLNKLIPGVASYTLMTNKSDESKLFLQFLKGMNLDLDLTIYEIDNYTQWQAKIKELKTDVVILGNYSHLAEAEGAMEVLKWTKDNLSVPTLAFTEAAIAGGALLGIIESGYEHGSVASQRVNSIIEGKRPNQLVIAMGTDGITCLNKTTAEKLGLDYSMLDIDILFE